MTWLQGSCSRIRIAFFLVLGLGYLFGKIAIGSFKLGAVTGTLLAECSSASSASRCERGQAVLLPAVPVRHRLPDWPTVLPRPEERRLAHAALAAIVARLDCSSPGSWPDCSL